MLIRINKHCTSGSPDSTGAFASTGSALSPNPTGSLDPASPPTAVRSTAESVGSCSVLSFESSCRRCCRRRGVGGAVDVVDDAERRYRVDAKVLSPPQSCDRP